MTKYAAILGLLMMAASPQDGVIDNADDSKNKTKNEKPCCENGKPKEWALYNKGVKWTDPLDEAVQKAKDKRKLLMVVHFVGRMDKEGC